LACVAVFTGAAVLANPYYVLDGGYYLRGFFRQAFGYDRSSMFGTSSMRESGAFIGVLVLGAGYVQAIVGLAGLALMARQRSRWAALLLTPAAVYLLTLTGRAEAYPRFLLPVTHLLPLGFALAADRWCRRAKRGRLWLVALVAAGAAQPLAKSIRHDLLITRDDTRELARRWVEQNVPRHARVLIEGPFPAMPTHPYSFYVGTKLPFYFRQVGADYLICNRIVRRAWQTEPGGQVLAVPLYDKIESQFVPVASFMPSKPGANVKYHLGQSDSPLMSLWSVDRPGPGIQIYRLRSPAPRPVDVPVRRRRPFTNADWQEIADDGIFPDGSLLLDPSRGPLRIKPNALGIVEQ